MPLTEAKHQQRQESLATIRALSVASRAAKSSAIVEHLLAHPALGSPDGGFVLAFAALPSEPDLAALPLRAPSLRFCLPRVTGPDNLAIHQVPDFENLRLSGKRIAEPDPGRHPEIALSEITVILVPGLAFSTRTGHRLGRGGGYYDRFLARPELAAALRLGICFDEQAIPHVLSESHDCRVGEIITDLRRIRFA